MPRSLPLSAPAARPVEDTGTSAPLTGQIAVYDPAMCCPTGVCGPGVDPELLSVARDLRWLEKQGATVERFGLAQQPDAFVSNPRVAGLMQAFGDGALPAVLVNGEILSHGRYAARDEILGALRHSKAPSSDEQAPCCNPGSGCC